MYSYLARILHVLLLLSENRYRYEAMVENEPVLFEILDISTKVSSCDPYLPICSIISVQFDQAEPGGAAAADSHG